MKLLFVVVSLFVLQSVTCQDGGVVTDKKCENFLSADVCNKLRNLATLLHEKTSIVTDAVRDAIKHHKTKAADMLGFIKGYIAERFPCDQVLTADLCKKIFDLGNRVKLTTAQVRLAIESAVSNGAKNVQEIYQKAIDLMTTQITCTKIFSELACKNLKSAIQKFHEQRQLLNEAIVTAAQKHYNNAKDLLNAVKNTVIEKVVNFKCEDVVPSIMCTKIRDIANELHLSTSQIKEAIKRAIVNGAITTKEVFLATIGVFTNMFKCKTILGETACNNLLEIVKKLHEQSHLVREAIVDAILNHVTNVKDIIVYVKNKIVEAAVNFNCTDILTQQQCSFLAKLAKRFHLRTNEVTIVIIQAIVNGTKSALEIYKVTIGQMIKDAKSIECEDLIPTAICTRLDNLAKKFSIRKEEVSIIVRTIIAGGAVTVQDIYKKAKEYLIEKISCDNFLGKTICNTFEALTTRLHVSFKKVTIKIGELVASGITSVLDIQMSIISYIWNLFFGIASKRSLDSGSFTDKIMAMVEKVINIGKDVKEKLKVEIKKSVEQGKVTLFKLKAFVQELIAKYGPQSDEVAGVHTSLVQQLKEALKNAHGKAKEKIEQLLKKTKEQLQKLKEYIKSILGGNDEPTKALDTTYDMFADAAKQELDDEIKMAHEDIESLVSDALY